MNSHPTSALPPQALNPFRPGQFSAAKLPGYAGCRSVAPQTGFCALTLPNLQRALPESSSAATLVGEMLNGADVIASYQHARPGIEAIVESLRSTRSLRYFGAGSSLIAPAALLADEIARRELGISFYATGGREGMGLSWRGAHTCLFVTNSGRTKELLELAHGLTVSAPQGLSSTVFPVTTQLHEAVAEAIRRIPGAQSPLAGVSLVQPFERCVQATYSVIDTLLVMSEVLACYEGRSQEFQNDIASLAPVVRAALHQPIDPAVFGAITSADTLIFAGPPIVSEMALKTGELFRGSKRGEQRLGALMAHGPIESLQPGMTVVLVDPAPAFFSDLKKNALFSRGAQIVLISDRNDLCAPDGSALPRIPVSSPDSLPSRCQLLRSTELLAASWNALVRSSCFLFGAAAGATKVAAKANV